MKKVGNLSSKMGMGKRFSYKQSEVTSFPHIALMLEMIKEPTLEV